VISGSSGHHISTPTTGDNTVNKNNKDVAGIYTGAFANAQTAVQQIEVMFEFEQLKYRDACVR